MRNVRRCRVRFSWMLSSVAALAAAQPASSICSQYSAFGQMDPSCGGDYCYVVSPGYNTQASVVGSFWSHSTGDPAWGQGDDNGAWSDDQWLLPWGSAHFLTGNWNDNGAIDGCILGLIAPGKSSEIMVALFSDDGGTLGYFAVAAVRRVPGAETEFDFTFAGGEGQPRDIDLVALPNASAYSVSKDVYVFRSPSLAALSEGVYGDGSLTAAEMITGYRVYASPQNPTSRLRTAGWTAFSGVVPLGQDVTVSSPCPTDDGDQYFAYSLVFDGGFETAHVGRSLRVICNRCPPDKLDFDRDGWPSVDADPECIPGWDTFDCNDHDPNVHPGALEICNGLDDDCNQVVDDVALPGPPADVRVRIDADTTRVEWSALPVATTYDVVRGDLMTLLSTGGDFADATDACLANDLVSTGIDDPEVPVEGGGLWYLVRASNCTGTGSHDGPGSSQPASRDAGIAASLAGCP